MDRLFHVALKITHNQGILTYRLKDRSAKDYTGFRVIVTVKNRATLGVIIDEVSSAGDPSFALKDIIDVLDTMPAITMNQLALMRFCAHYYHYPLGPVVHLAIPRHEKPPKALKEKFFERHDPRPFSLTPEQEKIATTIIDSPPQPFLLEGVTGSGKTMVYIKAAQAMLNAGRSVLFLVPEISLTPQLVERVESSLGQKAHTLHSNISPQKKRDTIFSLLQHESQVVIGARSAIFAPVKNLGLIVVDEEHDSSLKQDDTVRYHARDLALWRAKNEQAHIILGSATPSLESIVNVQKQKLRHLKLGHRYGVDKKLPTVHIINLKERAADVDMRTKDQSLSAGQKMCILSRPMILAIKETLAQKAQVVLFLNQRGYAKFGVCYDCGHLMQCPFCSVSLTYYQRRKALSCHHCKYTEAATARCKNCHRQSVHYLGLGTERLEEEVRMLFPDSRIVRLDRDVVQSQRRLESTLFAMHNQEADILIGTQMVTKGHDFAHVGLVGVVCADVLLSMPDFRAAEKTFQLLTQVAGRAGRSSLAGQALIQTFNPDHPSIVFAKTHHVADFHTQELASRKRFNQPPFSKACLIRCEHKQIFVAEQVIAHTHDVLKNQPGIKILGPVPSPIEKINQRFRFQCLIMAETSKTLHQALAAVSKDAMLTDIIHKKQVRFIIDVDPYNMS